VVQAVFQHFALNRGLVLAPGAAETYPDIGIRDGFCESLRTRAPGW
jgi:hypothetical protein